MISSLFTLAVAALLYIVYLQAQEAAHIELPTGLTVRKSASIATAPKQAAKEILVLNSYHAGHVWSDNEMAGILEVVQEASPAIRYHIEYLDCKYLPAYEHFEQVRDLFQRKYGHRDIPVVIVADNPALEFAITYRAQLFPRAAIVFCGVNNFKPELLHGQGNITGLAEALDAANTVRTALQLHPATREIVIVHDYTATGLATIREAEAQLQGLRDQVSFRDVADMPRQELQQFLQGLPKDSLVLALTYSVFQGGEVISHEDLARLLSENSPVPVYGVHQERLGYGIVGGSLLGGKVHGAQAARVALQILAGTPAADIPIDMNPPTRLLFDYNQLVRFGLPLSALPKDAVVVNRPIPFISSHRYLVGSTLLVIVVLTAGIVVLGVNVYQRRLAEEGLLQSQQELATRVLARTAELREANAKLHVELTERQRVEEVLRQREAELKESQRLAHIGSWDWDADQDVIWWSDEYYRIHGLDLDQPATNYAEHLQAYTAESVARLEAAVKRAMASGEPYELDLELANPTATTRWVVARGEAKRDAEGRIWGLRGTAQDISERKRTEQERLDTLRFFESMDRINRAIQGTNDIVRMMRDALDVVLSIFECDRAFLMYPCQAEAASWRVPMERNRPEYPGAFALGVEMPMDEAVAGTLRILLAADGPVRFGPEGEHSLPRDVAARFGFQSFMAMALYPKVGKPWQFGLHQCSGVRVWTAEEERLFAEIGRRLDDALTSLLMLRDLRENESKLAEAQSIAHFGYWDRNLDAGRITLSDEACRIFGLPPQEGSLDLGEWHERWLELIHPEDRPRTAQAIAGALAGGPRYDVEYRVVRPNGEVRIVHSYAEVTRDESGRPRRIIGTMQDITERKQAEEALKKSEARYRLIVDTANEGIWMLGADLTTTFINARMAEMIGYRPEEMIGRPMTDFMFAEDAPAHQVRMENRRQGMSEHYDIRYRHRDGKTVWAVASAVPIRDAGQNVIGSFAMFTDITEKKLAEEELRRLNDELEQRVLERTAELAAKNAELMRLNRLFVGRELRMVELKRQIQGLEVKPSETGSS